MEEASTQAHSLVMSTGTLLRDTVATAKETKTTNNDKASSGLDTSSHHPIFDPPSSLPPPHSYTLRCLQSLPLPSPSTCFNNLRICARTTGPFASLSSTQHGELEVVKRRRVYKMRVGGARKADNKEKEKVVKEKEVREG